MNKKAIIIIIVVLVFLVIGVVIYMVMSSNKKPTQTTQDTSKSQTGLSNILSNTNPGTLGALVPLLGLIGK